jgi:hypothetical protein
MKIQLRVMYGKKEIRKSSPLTIKGENEDEVK